MIERKLVAEIMPADQDAPVVTRQDVLDIIMEDPNTVALRTNDIVQAALTDEMTDTVRIQDSRGKWHEWRVSKGATMDVKRGVELRLARALDGVGIDSHPMVIQGKNPNVVVARFYEGTLINNDSSVTPLGDESQQHSILDMVTDVLKSAGRAVNTENIEKLNAKFSRRRKAGRFVRGLVFTGILAAGAPFAIDQVDEFLQNRHTEQLANDKADAEQAAIDAKKAQEASDKYKQSIIDFDAAYPTLTAATVLTDGELAAVSATEQFDLLDVSTGTVPPYNTDGALLGDITNIRSFELPNEGECSIAAIALPAEAELTAAHTADPRLLITVTANAAQDSIEVCALNPNKVVTVDNQNADSESVANVSGVLLIQQTK